MAGRGEGRGAGSVGDASLQEGDGGGCGPGVLASLLNLVQQLTAADPQDPALQQRPQLVVGPHALVGKGRGSGDRGRRVLPSEADGGGPRQEAELQRDEFRRWDLGCLQTACTSLGSAQKATTTSRVRRRSHDGLRWGARNWLMGL